MGKIVSFFTIHEYAETFNLWCWWKHWLPQKKQLSTNITQVRYYAENATIGKFYVDVDLSKKSRTKEGHWFGILQTSERGNTRRVRRRHGNFPIDNESIDPEKLFQNEIGRTIANANLFDARQDEENRQNVGEEEIVNANYLFKVVRR